MQFWYRLKVTVSFSQSFMTLFLFTWEISWNLRYETWERYSEPWCLKNSEFHHFLGYVKTLLLCAAAQAVHCPTSGDSTKPQSEKYCLKQDSVAALTQTVYQLRMLATDTRRQGHALKRQREHVTKIQTLAHSPMCKSRTIWALI